MYVRKDYFLLVFISLLVRASCQDLFPRKVWLYWDEPIQNAPILVRLCHAKFIAVCQKQNWQLNLLSNQNLPKYITNYTTKIQEATRNSKVPYKQTFADLVRLTVLAQHGGVYFDVTSILTHGLQWIQTLGQHPHLITNKIKGKNPELLIPYTNYYQSTTQSRGEQNTIINPMPGFQIWFIAAQQNSAAMQMWRQTYSYYYQHTVQENLVKFDRQDNYFRDLDLKPYFNGNKAIYATLQRKQFELDHNLGLFGHRQLSINFYNVWGFHGEFGPLFFSLKGAQYHRQMFEKTLEQIKQEYIDLKFYIKLTNVQRPFFQKQINFLIELAQQDLKFQNFLLTSPSAQQCNQYSFPVQGSIMSKLIEENPLASQWKLFYISKQQQLRWKTYCADKIISKLDQNSENQGPISDTIFNLFKTWLIPSFINSFSNNYETKKYEQELSLSAKLHIFYKNNEAQLKIFMIFAVFITIASGLLWFVVFLGLKLIQGLSNCWGNSQNVQKYQTLQRDQNQNLSYKQKCLFYAFFLTNMVILMYYQLYRYAGDTHSDKRLLFFFVCTFILRKYTEKCIPSNSMVFFSFTMRQCRMAFDPVIGYQLGKQILNWTTIRQYHLFAQAIVICLIFPFLLKMAEDLKSQSTNVLLKSLLKIQKYHPYIIILFMLTCFLTNIRYIVHKESYLIRTLPLLIGFYVGILYVLIVFEIIQKLYVLFRNCMNQKQPRQYEGRLSQHTYNISFMIEIGAIWYLCYNADSNWALLNQTEYRIKLQVIIILFFTILGFSNHNNSNKGVAYPKMRAFYAIFGSFQFLITHGLLFYLAFIFNTEQTQVLQSFVQYSMFSVCFLVVKIIALRLRQKTQTSDFSNKRTDFDQSNVLVEMSETSKYYFN